LIASTLEMEESMASSLGDGEKSGLGKSGVEWLGDGEKSGLEKRGSQRCGDGEKSGFHPG